MRNFITIFLSRIRMQYLIMISRILLVSSILILLNQKLFVETLATSTICNFFKLFYDSFSRNHCTDDATHTFN